MFLAKAYLQYSVEKMLPIIFHERVYSLTEFLTWGLSDGVVMLAAFRQYGPEESDYEFCGLSWVNRARDMGAGKKKSEIAMGFFRAQQVKNLNLRFGRLMLRWVFDNLDIDVLFGTTPVQNHAALRYSKQIGFSLHGPIPSYTTWKGELTSVWVSMMSREQFLENGR